MAVKKGLGKGLDSLITDKVNTKPAASKNNPTPKSEHAADAIMMNITKVEPNREQPRKKFDEDALLELAESIKQYGVLQPLLVQEREDYYEIVAGERRWRAAKIAGIKEIPVIIKKLTRQEIMEISLIENIQREDLNPIEEALAFKRLLTEFNLKQDEVAERVSKSRTAVTNAMRLLKLNEKVQQMVIDEMLTTGHARALLGIEDQEQQDSGDAIDFGEGKKNIFALESATVLRQIDKGVQLAVNTFGQGRGVYISGLPYSFANSRLLYRAILWAASAEGKIHRWFSTNYNVEVHAYVKNGKYCVVNNTYEPQQTTVYRGDGSSFAVDLAANAILWYEI